jgi:hypothetical protein
MTFRSNHKMTGVADISLMSGLEGNPVIDSIQSPADFVPLLESNPRSTALVVSFFHSLCPFVFPFILIFCFSILFYSQFITPLLNHSTSMLSIQLSRRGVLSRGVRTMAAKSFVCYNPWKLGVFVSDSFD